MRYIVVTLSLLISICVATQEWYKECEDAIWASFGADGNPMLRFTGKGLNDLGDEIGCEREGFKYFFMKIYDPSL